MIQYNYLNPTNFQDIFPLINFKWTFIKQQQNSNQNSDLYERASINVAKWQSDPVGRGGQDADFKIN